MKTLRELIIDSPAEKAPDGDAFQYLNAENGIVHITHSQYKSDAYAFGAWLISEGVCGNIGILGENGYAWCLAHTTITCGVGCAVGIDCDLSEQEIAAQLTLCDSKVFLYTRSHENIAQAVSALMSYPFRLICIEDAIDFVRKSTVDIATYERISVDFDKVISIFFTSGTTGTTKGIEITHKNIVACVCSSSKWSQYTEDDTILSVLPLHHCYALICCTYLPLFSNMKIGICSSLRRLLQSIRLIKPNYMHVVPAIIEMLYKAISSSGETAESYLNTSIKWLVSGGAALSDSVINGMSNYGIAIYCGYGLTECTSSIIMQCHDNNKPNSIGKPLDGVQIEMIDGEICVRGDAVFKGYLKDEEATKEVLYDGWFHTGDLGTIDDDGFVYITGRKKNLIILSNGKNVSPEELEQRLSAITEIREVIVYEENGLITAEIFPDSVSSDCEKIIGTKVHDLNKSLPVYKQIADIKFRQTEFEKTATKKIKRRKN